jgi:hypothetical protein
MKKFGYVLAALGTLAFAAAPSIANAQDKSTDKPMEKPMEKPMADKGSTNVEVRHYHHHHHEHHHHHHHDQM